MRIEKIVSNKEELLRLIPDGTLGAEIGSGHFTENIRDHLPSASALCTSVKSLKKFPDEFFDWIYLNSDIETFKEDLNVCSKKVKVGGLVCGSNYRHGGDSYAVSVRSVMHKLLDDHDFKLKYLTDENDGNLSFAVSKQGSIHPLKSLLIFVHYNREEPCLHLPEYVKKYVKALMPFFTDTVISSNYKGPEWNGVPIMRFENVGYDFGFFYQALQNIELGEYERIAFVNDSNEVVKLGSFNSIFEWANQEENELWGLTDNNYGYGRTSVGNYHIQSHFLVFEKKGIERLESFFEHIRFGEDYLIRPTEKFRRKIVNRCEVGLSQFFMESEMKIGSYFSVNDLKSPNVVPECEPFGMDLTINYWEKLVDDGYPLIKRKVIDGSYVGLGNWRMSKLYLDLATFKTMSPERKVKKILFINHSESRTGAPKVVFDVAKEMKKYFEVKMVSLENLENTSGSMHQEFKENFDVIYPNGLSACNLLLKERPDLVYVNTIVSYEYAIAAKELDIPVIFHIHELESSFPVLLGIANRRTNKFTFRPNNVLKLFAKSADRFIAVSEATRIFIVKKLRCNPVDVDLINAFVSSKEVNEKSVQKTLCQVNEEINKEKDDIIVIGIGTACVRKGIDIFIESQQILKNKGFNNFKFIWIGGVIEDKDIISKIIDASEDLVFLGPKENPFPYLKSADIFVLPSREDPFPLVALEAMALGKPVVAFKDGGGIPEALEDDGEIVNEMNSESLANSILKLSNDKELMTRYSERAKKRQKKYYDKDVAISKIKLVIDECLKV